MTITPEVIDLHPVAHPVPAFRQVGFPLDHSYIEQTGNVGIFEDCEFLPPIALVEPLEVTR